MTAAGATLSAMLLSDESSSAFLPIRLVAPKQARREFLRLRLLSFEKSSASFGEYVGFPSQSYFCRMFRKVTGMTPREFREKHKPKEFL